MPAGWIVHEVTSESTQRVELKCTRERHATGTYMSVISEPGSDTVSLASCC